MYERMHWQKDQRSEKEKSDDTGTAGRSCRCGYQLYKQNREQSLAAVLQVSLSYLVGESTESQTMDEEMSRKYEACTDEQKRILLKIADILHESK